MPDVTKEEYDKHKDKCSKSFEDIFEQLSTLNRAVLGDKELGRKGVAEKTDEMYEAIIMAKGGERVFITLVKIAAGVVTITGAFWAVYELFKRITVK